MNSNGGGTFSFGGLLIAETPVRPMSVRDWLSKTMIIREQSDYSRLPDGSRKTCLGASLMSMSLSSAFPGDPRLGNLPTNKHPITKDATLQYGCHNSGPLASNTPLQSAHISAWHTLLSLTARSARWQKT